MSNDATGWRGLAADLMAAGDEATAASPAPPTPSEDLAVPSRRRRRKGEASFASTNQLVGLWFPNEMARELRSRAESAGLSNSEFVREILREHFSRSQ